MDFKDLYRTLEKNRYYIFSFEDLLTFYPGEDRASLKRMLYRWRQKGWIYSLKKGLYEITYPKDFAIPDIYIANMIYEPSYVSSETALSHYSIIPEISMAVTSITTKPTRRFKNKHGLFIYRTVKPVAFTGYYIESQGGFNVHIAEPEKAVVDFIHFKKYHNKEFSLRDERLDAEAIARLNKKKMEKYAEIYNINLKKDLYAYL